MTCLGSQLELLEETRLELNSLDPQFDKTSLMQEFLVISRLKKKKNLIHFKMWPLEELKFDVTNQAFTVISSPWDQGALFGKRWTKPLSQLKAPSSSILEFCSQTWTSPKQLDPRIGNSELCSVHDNDIFKWLTKNIENTIMDYRVPSYCIKEECFLYWDKTTWLCFYLNAGQKRQMNHFLSKRMIAE